MKRKKLNHFIKIIKSMSSIQEYFKYRGEQLGWAAELQKTEDIFRIFRRSIRTRCRLNLSLNVQHAHFTNIGNPKRYFGYSDSTWFFDRTLSLIWYRIYYQGRCFTTVRSITVYKTFLVYWNLKNRNDSWLTAKQQITSLTVVFPSESKLSFEFQNLYLKYLKLAEIFSSF